MDRKDKEATAPEQKAAIPMSVPVRVAVLNPSMRVSKTYREKQNK